MRARELPWERTVKAWPWETLQPPARLPVLSAALLRRALRVEGTGSMTVTALADVSPSARKRCLRRLSSEPHTRRLDLLASSRSRSLFLVQVADGFHGTVTFDNRFAHHWPQVFLETGEDGDLTVVERMAAAGPSGGRSLFVTVGAHSRLNYLFDATRRFPVQSFSSLELGQSSAAVFAAALIGRDFHHASIVSHCRSRYTTSRIVAAFRGTGESQSALGFTSSHRAAGSDANIAFAGIGADRSRASVDGMVEIAKRARQTSSFLSQDTLIVSSDARLVTVPNLEIAESEVRASHSATVGRLDLRARFYLESRGLEPERAEELMTAGFVRRLCAGIEHPAFRQRFEHALRALE